MLTYEKACEVARLIPFRLAGHIIVDMFSVDSKTIEIITSAGASVPSSAALP